MKKDNLSRRSFLIRFFKWLGLGFLISLICGVWRYLSPKRISESFSVFHLGFPEEYKPGSVSARWVKPPYKIWLIRDEDGMFYALYNECTHLGCALLWDERGGKFTCPCHKSEFNLQGHPLKGPASRALERVEIKLDTTGQISVDTARRFRFERGEWENPNSFLKL